jgi:hypothetical protein
MNYRFVSSWDISKTVNDAQSIQKRIKSKLFLREMTFFLQGSRVSLFL